MLEFVLGVTGKSGEYFEVQGWEEIGAIEGDVPVIDRVGDESAREASEDRNAVIRIDEFKVGAVLIEIGDTDSIVVLVVNTEFGLFARHDLAIDHPYFVARGIVNIDFSCPGVKETEGEKTTNSLSFIIAGRIIAVVMSADVKRRFDNGAEIGFIRG